MIRLLKMFKEIGSMQNIGPQGNLSKATYPNA